MVVYTVLSGTPLPESRLILLTAKILEVLPSLEKTQRRGRFSKRSNSSFTVMFCLAYFTIKSDRFFTIVCFLSVVLPRFVYHGWFARLFQRWNNLKMNAESFPKFLPKLIPDFVSKSRPESGPDSGRNCRREKYSVLFPP